MAISVNAFVSDGSVLLAFDMPKPDDSFAGFAIKCSPKGGTPYFLLNRLSFTQGVSKTTSPDARPYTSSDQAPFQKFSWLHFPKEADTIKRFQYEVTAMHFHGGGLVAGDVGKAVVDLSAFSAEFKHFTPGFTRGYLSSQAYAEEFHNAPIRPAGLKTMDFDTGPFEKQYAWLGYSARKLVFDFLQECIADKKLSVDLFAYDLDEPDFIKQILELAKQKRLRAFLDDAPLHTKAGAVEVSARTALITAAGNDATGKPNVVSGHFARFAHSKVLIQKSNGQPVKVLTGSANFSVRGLYVQANNVIVIIDRPTATRYEAAFETAFMAQRGQPPHLGSDQASRAVADLFKKSQVATSYMDCSGPGLPKFKVAFSPHVVETVSLAVVADAIKSAKSSVIFAVMELQGGGTVLEELSTLNQRRDIFAYGITQSAGKLSLFAPGSDQHGEFAAFAYLTGQVPAPFREEFSGGVGQVIHDKFVVVDFNDANPIVFTGSSNLAKGGEEENGDNLLAISDRDIATGYAVEGIRLVDHYHFRMLQQQHPDSNPVLLQGSAIASGGKRWWAPYYDKTDRKFNERMLFARGAG